MLNKTALLLCLAVPVIYAQDQAGCGDTEREAYMLAVSQAISEVWKVPFSSMTLSCTLQIQQNFRGEVLNVGIADCGDDAAVHKSVIDAGYLASPIPLPDNNACFARDLIVRVESRAQDFN